MSFKQAYPYMTLLYQVWLLSYDLGYLSGTTPYFRPWLASIGLDLRRVSLADMVSELAMAHKILVQTLITRTSKARRALGKEEAT
jgi:hypothetical protein